MLMRDYHSKIVINCTFYCLLITPLCFQAIEKNALLENEVEDKEGLQDMVQRLKDESRGSYITYILILNVHVRKKCFANIRIVIERKR